MAELQSTKLNQPNFRRLGTPPADILDEFS